MVVVLTNRVPWITNAPDCSQRPTHVRVFWDYADTNNVIFVILSRTNLLLGAWMPRTNTSSRLASFPMDRPQEFFTVRASNTVSHWVSP